MAPKKNGFFMFVSSYRDSEETQKLTSFQQLSEKLSPIWNQMSKDEKNKYKVLADKYNSKDKKKNKKKEEKTNYNPSPNYSLKSITSNVLNSVSDRDELLDKKFILLHVNCHAHVGEDYFFPAEISAVEFNLRKGLLRKHHAIIGISKIYPKGFAGAMREYSEKLHNIHCWEKHPDDYNSITSDFITFLSNEKKNHDDTFLDLPDLFTVENESCQNLSNIQNSLDRLYATAVSNGDSNCCKSVFKVKSLERLFLEIKTKLKVHVNPLNIIGGNSVCDILQYNMFGNGLSCMYHYMRDIPYKCSTSRVLQWMANICSHLHDLNGLDITPGKHVPFILRDGSKLFVDGENTPFSSAALKLKANHNMLYETPYGLSDELHNLQLDESTSTCQVLLDTEDSNFCHKYSNI